MFFFTWLARNTNGATPTGRCLRTKTDRHPVESKTLCDFHLKPQHPSAAQDRWEKVEEEEQEDKNKRLIEANGKNMSLFIIIINTGPKQGPGATEVAMR